MAIRYDGKDKVFYLHTVNTSYIFGFLEEHMVHIYWGKRLDKVPAPEKCVPHGSRPQALYNDPQRPDLQADYLPMEYSVYGHTDLRSPALHLQYEDGSTISEFRYVSHEILAGKVKPEGLPATFDKGGEAQTLRIQLSDEKTGAELYLYYSVFEEKDAITRHAELVNNGSDVIMIDRMLSASVDFPDRDFDAITLCGAVQRERYVARNPLSWGGNLIDSKRGASGHQKNPFYALAGKHTTEDQGDIYAMNFIYSGNFVAGAEVDGYESTRLYMGMNPFDFSWRLEPGEHFTAPEVVMVYSDQGIGGMSRIFHRLYRENLCRGKWALSHRPVKINSWETAGFDFDEDKLISLAETAADIGVEMLVLDDGWFGRRNDDNCSLGDWFVNTEKLPGGLSSLADRLKTLGMKLGVWFEPEMISPDSDLYRAHPDWCLHVEGRSRSMGRHQLILDFSNREICDYIISAISKILESADISYIKWDMNRNMTEVGSAFLTPERQRETAHRYMLGLYYVLETLTARFPDVIFESCAAGGGRFDGGMLYYTQQVWTSDNSDACDRAKIQYGTSLVYPTCTMSAHVSRVPNVVNGRKTPFESRCQVAMLGQFGFELDVRKLSEEEISQARHAVECFKKYRDVIHFGEMYRLSSPFDSNMAVWEFVSNDQKQVLLLVFNTLSEVNGPFHRIRMQALDEREMYVDRENDIEMTGAALMQLGIAVRNTGDFETKLFCFEKL